MTFVKSISAIIIAAAFVSGCSQYVKEDDLATGLVYETDSANIHTGFGDEVAPELDGELSFRQRYAHLFSKLIQIGTDGCHINGRLAWKVRDAQTATYIK